MLIVFPSFMSCVALPGMEKDQIKVEVKDGLLTISGERKQVAEEGIKFRTIETRYGTFSRSFRLGEATNAEAITAEFKNGRIELFGNRGCVDI